MKKLLCVLLSIIVMMSCMLTVSASETVATDGVLEFQYASDGETYTVSGCEPAVMDVVVIPEEVDGIPVTEISPLAFFSCEGISEIVCNDRKFDFSKKTIGVGNEVFINANWTFNETGPGVISIVCALVGVIAFFILLILFIKKKNKVLLIAAVIVAVVTAVTVIVSSGVFEDKDEGLTEIYEEDSVTEQTDVYVTEGDSVFVDNGDSVEYGGLTFTKSIEVIDDDTVNYVLSCTDGWEISETCDGEYDENEYRIGAGEGFVWKYLRGNISFYHHNGNPVGAVYNCPDVVAACTDYNPSNLYIAYNGGHDLKVVTTSDKVVLEKHYDSDVITEMHVDQGSTLNVTHKSGKVDYYDLSEFWRKFIYSIEATSTLAPQGNKTYVAENMLDENFDTVWSEGVEGSGIGEKIKVTIDPCISSKAFIIICNKNSDENFYEKNNRVKKAHVIDSTGKTQIVNVDHSDGYWIELGEDAEWFEIEILEIEKGTTYDDTCISEIRVTENFLMTNH